MRLAINGLGHDITAMQSWLNLLENLGREKPSHDHAVMLVPTCYEIIHAVFVMVICSSVCNRPTLGFPQAWHHESYMGILLQNTQSHILSLLKWDYKPLLCQGAWEVGVHCLSHPHRRGPQLE